MKRAISFLSILIIGLTTLVILMGNLKDRILEDSFNLDEIVSFADDDQKSDQPVSDMVGEKASFSDSVNLSSGKESVPKKIEGNNYAFSCLSEEERVVYQEIFYSIENCERESDVSTMDIDTIDKVYDCVMVDHPEFFYIDGYQYTEYSMLGKLDKLTFSGSYLYGKKEIRKRQKAIDKVVEEMLKYAPKTNDEYELVKYVYDTIIDHTEYDLDSVDNQNICSVFLNGRSVCQGYAKAFQYLLSKMDIIAPVVVGKVREGERHAWNLVRMNGRYYYVDVTWGDASFLLVGETEEPEIKNSTVNYDYLGVTTEQLFRTHELDMPIDMPECTEIQENYYVRNNAYFYAYDEKRLKTLVENAYNNGDETLTIKCSDDRVYEETRAQLISFQKIFSFLQSKKGSIAYTNNDTQRTLTFWL